MTEVATGRVIQEVQAAMTIAKRCPRDATAAVERIRKACTRTRLAEQAIYQYPRGGTKVSGPSIRLAEVMAQNWGNLDFGIVEVEQRNGESDVMAYCWDLETNTRQTKVFTVKHERHTRNGITKLTDPRDIYEMVANQGARRMRACILGVIPGDIQDVAVEQCDKTLAGDSSEPIEDRIRKMVAAFANYSVTPEMIEARIGHKLEAMDVRELLALGRIHNSLRDEMSTREKWFDIAASETVQSHIEQAAKKTQADVPQTPEENVAEQAAFNLRDAYTVRLDNASDLAEVQNLLKGIEVDVGTGNLSPAHHQQLKKVADQAFTRISRKVEQHTEPPLDPPTPEEVADNQPEAGQARNAEIFCQRIADAASMEVIDRIKTNILTCVGTGDLTQRQSQELHKLIAGREEKM